MKKKTLLILLSALFFLSIMVLTVSSQGIGSKSTISSNSIESMILKHYNNGAVLTFSTDLDYRPKKISKVGTTLKINEKKEIIIKDDSGNEYGCQIKMLKTINFIKDRDELILYF